MITPVDNMAGVKTSSKAQQSETVGPFPTTTDSSLQQSTWVIVSREPCKLYTTCLAMIILHIPGKMGTLFWQWSNCADQFRFCATNTT